MVPWLAASASSTTPVGCARGTAQPGALKLMSVAGCVVGAAIVLSSDLKEPVEQFEAAETPPAMRAMSAGSDFSEVTSRTMSVSM